MSARALDSARLHAAIAAQRARLGGVTTDVDPAGDPAVDPAGLVDRLARDVLVAHERACVDPSARRLVVRALAERLEHRAPGRSVEVRVPPDAAVQCVPGPRHTRGTPPAVVETDPVTFIRLAAGGLSWNQAVASGNVRLSGQRTDLSPWFPLVGPPASG